VKDEKGKKATVFMVTQKRRGVYLATEGGGKRGKDPGAEKKKKEEEQLITFVGVKKKRKSMPGYRGKKGSG